jgi:hypothetical protein
MDFPRVFRQQLDIQKGINVLHRIAHFSTARPALVYAVLYYADRGHLPQTGRTLYGETYLAYRHAPVPSWANHVFMTLMMPTRDNALYRQIRDKFLLYLGGALINRDMTNKGDSVLSHQERSLVDEALQWYKAAKPDEVLTSRRDRSWEETRHGEPIDIGLIKRYGRKAATGVEAGQIPPPKENFSPHALEPHFETLSQSTARAPWAPVKPEVFSSTY